MTQLFLTLLLGPFGLFYSSLPAGVLLVLAAAVLARDTGGPGALFAWPAAVAIGWFTVRRWNRRAAQLRSTTATTTHIEENAHVTLG